MVDITFRGPGPWGLGKGSRLIILEGDTNWYNLKVAIEDLIANPPEARSISDISVAGNAFTFTMSDSTFEGPLEIPIANLNPRGVWQPSTAYFVNDVVTYQGTVYFVTYAHTSALTFDPGATSGPGQDWYTEQIPVITFPGFEEWRLEEAGSGAASPTEGQIMVWTDGVWDVANIIDVIPTFEEHRAASASSGSPTPVAGDFLRAEGPNSWVPEPITYEGLRLESASGDTPEIGQGQRWSGSNWLSEGPTVTLAHATTALTLSTAHPNRYIRFTHASGCTVTVPANATFAIPIDSEIHLRQTTTGVVTVSAAGGVTLNVPDGFQSILLGQHATATLKKVGTNEWDIFGLLEGAS